MELNEKLKKELLATYEKLNNEGKLLSKDKLKQCYDLFRERFGPEKLLQLDGEALLNTMHGEPKPDSLMFWLEFKNDDELPARFGSIAGGNALKFEIFLRKETHEWTTGTATKQVAISTEEAVEIARRQRGELVNACKVLDALPTNASDDDYKQLQRDLSEQAPTVADKAWSHKYFSLLYPNKLDDFHTAHYQRFHLIKLLQLPPEGEGRFLCAGRYVDLAAELEMPINHLTSVLNARNGKPHRYWRIGTTDGRTGRSYWGEMRDGKFVSIGWAKLGDLRDYACDQRSKDALKELMAENYPGTAQSVGIGAAQVFKFLAHILEGDLVVACEGRKVLGVGRVTGGYEYDASSGFPHRRPVEWLSLDQWQMPNKNEGLRTTVWKLGKYPENLVAIEKRIRVIIPPPRPHSIVERPHPIVERIESILRRKGQVILYGPPGTGKTYWAIRAARELAARSSYGKPYDQLSDQEKATIEGQEGTVRTCCFHPAYGYEDFIEGFRPSEIDGKLVFELRDGIFKKLCKDAEASPNSKFYLIIDEINRGDIPRIFGELLTILEKDKRGQELILPLSGERFSVPANVYVIGTMNTADRSIALLDTALRRRFGFVELMPDSSLLKGPRIEGLSLELWLDALNRRILDHIGRDARNLQVGHAYLMQSERPVPDFATFSRVLRDDILPLLQEYCYEDYAKLEAILGPDFVDAENQQLSDDIFEPRNQDGLIQALFTITQDLAASAKAIALEEGEVEEDHDEDDGGSGPEGQDN
ncbi:MAG TPA: AAA family ATPase [bacterium]|nr:AAA family ATPase [bacterium]